MKGNTKTCWKQLRGKIPWEWMEGLLWWVDHCFSLDLNVCEDIFSGILANLSLPQVGWLVGSLALGALEVCHERTSDDFSQLVVFRVLCKWEELYLPVSFFVCFPLLFPPVGFRSEGVSDEPSHVAWAECGRKLEVTWDWSTITQAHLILWSVAIWFCYFTGSKHTKLIT